MDSAERTRDIYEGTDCYPQPPLQPLPPVGDPDELLAFGITPTPLARFIYNTTRSISGYRRFQHELPARLDPLLRSHNLRGAYLFAPVVAATVALADDPRPLEALDRAATLILAAQSLAADLYAGRLAPDMHQGQPLEMGLYYNLFATSLIVEGKQARLFKSTRLDTIAVILDGRFYLLNIGPPDSGTTFTQLRTALADLVAFAAGKPVPVGPGSISAAEHATQLRTFRHMQQDPVNAHSLNLLQHTLLTLCLDLDARPDSYAATATLAQIGNCANRWYHASLQIVVAGNSRAALVCNFNAYLDGNAMMRAGMELHRRAAACPVAQLTQPAQALAPAVALDWHIDPGVVTQAEQEIAHIRDDQPAVFKLPGYGRRFFADRGCDPVAAFVLALQITTARLCDKPAGIVQFLTNSRYRYTDVTTISVTTPATRQFVAAINEPVAGPAALRALFFAAVEAYQCTCRQARQFVPHDTIHSLFFDTSPPIRRFGAGLIHISARLLLRMLGLQRFAPREVLISHPAIYPETPLVGRPGIRLPYVRYFGLHYQIWPEETVIIPMPALDWNTPNARLIAEIQADLERIGRLLDSAPAAPEPLTGVV